MINYLERYWYCSIAVAVAATAVAVLLVLVLVAVAVLQLHVTMVAVSGDSFDTTRETKKTFLMFTSRRLMTAKGI